MRRVLRKVAANEEDSIGDLSTLADPSVSSTTDPFVYRLIRLTNHHSVGCVSAADQPVPLVEYR